MKEYYVEKIRELTTLRTSLFTAIIILTGGMVGLFFTDANLILRFALFILGLHFDVVFLNNMISTHNDIRKTLEELKNGCK
ncbi:hypothetical protein J6P92_04310 [bacterium]|nr:hypothetical protein [bacterium]